MIHEITYGPGKKLVAKMRCNMKSVQN